LDRMTRHVACRERIAWTRNCRAHRATPLTGIDGRELGARIIGRRRDGQRTAATCMRGTTALRHTTDAAASARCRGRAASARTARDQHEPTKNQTSSKAKSRHYLEGTRDSSASPRAFVHPPAVE
jgi:hypothetical protein